MFSLNFKKEHSSSYITLSLFSITNVLLRMKNETFTKPTINFTVLLALRQVCRCAPLSIISLKTRDKHSHMLMLCTSLPASLIEKQYCVLGMCALIRLITCFYTQYRMRNAIMRNRLKGDLS